MLKTYPCSTLTPMPKLCSGTQKRVREQGTLVKLVLTVGTQVIFLARTQALCMKLEALVAAKASTCQHFGRSEPRAVRPCRRSLLWELSAKSRQRQSILQLEVCREFKLLRRSVHGLQWQMMVSLTPGQGSLVFGVDKACPRRACFPWWGREGPIISCKCGTLSFGSVLHYPNLSPVRPEPWWDERSWEPCC